MSYTNEVCRVLASLARHVDSPLARGIELLARAGEWAQLQQLSPVAPSAYSNALAYHADAILVDFARKSPVPGSSILHDRAVATFFACEKVNALTNARLMPFIRSQGPFGHPSDLALLPFIKEWRKNISRVLGKLPGHLNMRFSPGATVGNRGLKITIPDKIESEPVFYPQTTLLKRYVRDTAWGRLHQRERVVAANEFFSVPKDARTNRGCCKEASGNVTLQLAAGRAIRASLAKWGIDLDHGQTLHRDLARKASRDGSLATIDLSNASDTVSKNLVRLILPDEWLALLEELRAPSTKVDGKVYYLEKFSSMGNGFTFELETLIFYTLAITVAGGSYGRIKVYGDDIIVPTEHAQSLLSALRFFGFTPNTNKTYTEGQFRESCGGDFFDGVPVRAHFQKNYLTKPQEWIALHNGLRRLSRPEITREAENLCLQSVPRNISQLRGPSVLGDVVFHRPFKWTAKDGWDGFFIRGFTPVAKVLPYHHWSAPVVYASALYGVPQEGVHPRGMVSGYKIRTLFVPRAALLPIESDWWR